MCTRADTLYLSNVLDVTGGLEVARCNGAAAATGACMTEKCWLMEPDAGVDSMASLWIS